MKFDAEAFWDGKPCISEKYDIHLVFNGQEWRFRHAEMELAPTGVFYFELLQDGALSMTPAEIEDYTGLTDQQTEELPAEFHGLYKRTIRSILFSLRSELHVAVKRHLETLRLL